jgi:hypothetical protein
MSHAGCGSESCKSPPRPRCHAPPACPRALCRAADAPRAAWQMPFKLVLMRGEDPSRLPETLWEALPEEQNRAVEVDGGGEEPAVLRVRPARPLPRRVFFLWEKRVRQTPRGAGLAPAAPPGGSPCRGALSDAGGVWDAARRRCAGRTRVAAAACPSSTVRSQPADPARGSGGAPRGATDLRRRFGRSVALGAAPRPWMAGADGDPALAAERRPRRPRPRSTSLPPQTAFARGRCVPPPRCSLRRSRRCCGRAPGRRGPLRARRRESFARRRRTSPGPHPPVPATPRRRRPLSRPCLALRSGERCASGLYGVGERCASGLYGVGERCASGLYRGGGTR